MFVAVTKSENIIWDKKPHQDNSCICPCLLLFFGVQCLKCYILQTPILSVNLVFNKTHYNQGLLEDGKVK